MAVRLAKRMQILKASDIREMLKVTQHLDVISFAGGLPAPEFFPSRALADAARDVLAGEGASALQYSTTEGHPGLRGKIARRLDALWGARLQPDEILVTTGSQQGLDLVGKLFLDDGDAVACESPTYLGAISAWNLFRPRWLEIPTDDEGMDVGALEEALDRNWNVKFIYVVPNFQNPSGRTWSLRRRRLLMELVRRKGIPLVEDNPYGELRFEGETLPSLQSMDDRGLVIQLGTFSKVFCPGLRLGWVAARSPLYEKLVILKQGADLHTSTLHQMEVDRYLEEHDLSADVAALVPAYRERRDAMVEALEREMRPGVRFTRPQGGLFLWAELPEGFDSRALLERCLSRGVAFVPGEAFFPNGGRRNTLRLNFSNQSPERIREGVRRMAEALRELTAAVARREDLLQAAAS